MSRRIKVAFFADVLHAPIGGGVTSGVRFVEKLHDHGVDVTVLSTDATDGEGLRLPGFVLPVHAMRAMKFVMARPDPAIVSRAIADADVVHLQFPFWLSFSALSEAKRAGKPVVCAFHVQPENALYNVGIRSRVIQDAVYRFWIDRLYGRADIVVCPTPFAEAKLRSHGLSVPTRVVSNGVPEDISREGDRERAPHHKDAFVILCLGRFAAEKRQDLVIEAVRRSRHAERIQLVLAGAGPQEAELRELASTLPRPAEVGFLPRPDLLRLLRSADLLVHASEVELEGIAVLEALGSGLPAIVANAPESAAKDLALGPDYLFRAGDAHSLTSRIDALIESPARLTAGRMKAAQMARTFDFDTAVEDLASVYAEAITLSANELRRSA